MSTMRISVWGKATPMEPSFCGPSSGLAVTQGEASVRPKPSVMLAWVMLTQRRRASVGNGAEPETQISMQVRSYFVMSFCCMSDM